MSEDAWVEDKPDVGPVPTVEELKQAWEAKALVALKALNEFDSRDFEASVSNRRAMEAKDVWNALSFKAWQAMARWQAAVDKAKETV